jgi:hypothetical protein
LRLRPQPPTPAPTFVPPKFEKIMPMTKRPRLKRRFWISTRDVSLLLSPITLDRVGVQGPKSIW